MKISTVFLFIIFFILCSCSRKNYFEKEFLITNSTFKSHLKTNVLEKLNDQIIIDYIFENMENRISINNSENYFYFEFLLNGRHFKGNIGLLVKERDENLISLGCEELTNIEEKYYKPISIEKLLGINDGLKLQKIATRKYIIKYKGKSIKLNIDPKLFMDNFTNDITLRYEFIGKSFDDSGLVFNFCYNKNLNHFLYLLDDTENTNLLHFVKLNPNVLVEIRSGFAFYKNEFNDKILIGVLTKNEIFNTMYDGPFDQLPDNQIMTTNLNLGSLIKNSNVNNIDELDFYGNFKLNGELRVAISAYYSYETIDDLMNNFYKYLEITKEENILVKHLTNVNY